MYLAIMHTCMAELYKLREWLCSELLVLFACCFFLLAKNEEKAEKVHHDFSIVLHNFDNVMLRLCKHGFALFDFIFQKLCLAKSKIELIKTKYVYKLQLLYSFSWK